MILTKQDKTLQHRAYEPWVEFIERALTAFKGYPRFTNPGVLWLSGDTTYATWARMEDYRNGYPYRKLFNPAVVSGPNSTWGIYVARLNVLPRNTAILTHNLADIVHYTREGGDESKFLVLLLDSEKEWYE